MPSLSPSSNLSENPNGNPVLSLDPSFNPWDFSLSTQLPRDDDNDEDEDDDGNDDDGGGNDNDNYDDNLIDVNDNDNLMRLQTFDLNNIEGMSEYEVLRLRRIRRNEAKLTSLGLLEPMTSAASLSSDRSNSKKRSAPQDDVERQVQPTRNAKKMTSYRDLDFHVIFKRTRPIDSSDTGEEDIVCKRMREDEAEYSPSKGDDEEEYDEDEEELESSEFNSHILQMSLLSTSDSQPLNPCKCRSSSPRCLPISICRVLQGRKAIN